jgi:hypothetical protein
MAISIQRLAPATRGIPFDITIEIQTPESVDTLVVTDISFIPQGGDDRGVTRKIIYNDTNIHT